MSKGDGASVELSYCLCVWIVEKKREGHSRKSRQNDHRHKQAPCVSIIRGRIVPQAWIPASPGVTWIQTPQEPWTNTTANAMQAQSLEHKSGFNTGYPKETRGWGGGTPEQEREYKPGLGPPERGISEDHVCFRFSMVLLTQDVFKSS